MPLDSVTIGMLIFQGISFILHTYQIKNSTCSIKNLFGCFSATATVDRNQQPSAEMTEAEVR